MKPAPRRAFSLVELLVVITIVTLLAAMLFPAYAAVVDYANMTKCKNQLGQIASAVKAYAGRNRGTIPPAEYEATGLSWCNILQRGGYLSAPNTVDLDADMPTEEDSVLLCPTSVDIRVEIDDLVPVPAIVNETTAYEEEGVDYAQGWYRSGTVDLMNDCSYYWNGCTDDDVEGWRDFPSILIRDEDDSYLERGYLHNMSEIRKHSTMVLATDGVWWGAVAMPERGRIAARHPGDQGRRSRTVVAYYDGHVDVIERKPADDWDEDPIMTLEELKGGPPFFRLSQQRLAPIEEQEEQGP